MAVTKVKNDLIPFRAGIVRITPLDGEFVPQYAKSYTTNRAYLVSTQVTETRSVETVPNGNGQDGEWPLDQVFNLAVAMNTYDPKFHAIVAGRTKVAELKPVMTDTTIIPKTGSGGAEYTFSNAKEYPVAAKDGKFYLEIKDAYGNVFTQTDGMSPSLGEANFKYENESHKLTFAAQYKDKPLTCVYYIASEGGDGYEVPDTLEAPVFQIEVMGETQSASSNETINYYSVMARASVSGDLPDITTQKAKTSTLTYNFKSKPVPKGVKPFYNSFTPAQKAQ